MSPPSKLSAALYSDSDYSVSEIAPFRENELSSPEEFERLNRRLTRSFSPRVPKSKKVKDGEKSALCSAPQKKVVRRRKIDPATSNRNYTSEEVEFMNALNDYKRSSGRMFPTCCEILEVIKGLGYEKTLAGIAAADN